MVDSVEVQTAIVAKLKAFTPLTDLCNDIRELEFQGREFNYPSVRIRMGYMQPIGNGNCRPTRSEVPFTIAAFSDADASDEAQHVAHQIVRCLFGVQLAGPLVGPTSAWKSLRINNRGKTGPMRATIRSWRVNTYFWVNIYE